MHIRPTVAERRISAALLACAKFEPDIPRLRAALGQVEVSDLATAAQFHGVAPLVHNRMGLAGLPPHDDLGDIYKEQLFRHLIVMAELSGISAALNAAGVDWVVFKGPVIAAAYERDDLRSYSDVDLLVDRHRLKDALDILYSAGCSQVDRNWPMINAQTRGEMSLATRNGVALDLHWAFVNESRTRLALGLPVESMLSRGVTRVVADVALRTLEPHDELAYVALHAILSGGHRLVWLVDVDRLVRARVLNWSEVVHAARRSGMELPLSIMLDRARRYLGTEVPLSVTRSLAGPLGWRGLMRAVDMVRSPVGSFAGGMSGRIFAQSFRGTTAATAVGLVQELRDRRDRHGAAPVANNPLHDDVPDGDARQLFLQRVMSHTAV